MSAGLDWYKREPVAFLGDVQGLPAKQLAVYSVILDLLYVHAGEIRNDPKWISGWISDMGSSAVRTAIAQLDANPRITLMVTDDTISQKRAKTEAKRKRNQRENASVSGRIGGERSAVSRARSKENNGLGEAKPSSKIQAEKRREDTVPNGTDASRLDGMSSYDRVWHLGVPFLMDRGSPETQARKLIGKWLRDHRVEDVLEAFRSCQTRRTGDPVAYITATLKEDSGNGKRNHDPSRPDASARAAAFAAGARDTS